VKYPGASPGKLAGIFVGEEKLLELFKNFSFKQQPLKNSKMRSILQDLQANQRLANNQQGTEGSRY
jgi:hypothetical protein